ncbi:hypothetical protein GJT93_01460 [Enterobacteriaceae endosymbiont of Donacia provostii]|uniref:DNA polymerase III subunit delta n=1 Tax=Enterobacteriaceae endosymbiont of Donacia provostii TaxID=2675781 RepID=UPI0014495A78|nr:hypothetical protein [Enterobacteriaceae endosymbiont of Donacia provostii]QJC33767.1 hypothetical protein GJT93_01460 [Enterobacteriaceae endosymbiont of Donacia provostii]
MNDKICNNFYINMYNKRYYCYIIAGDELFFLKKNLNLLLKKLLSLNFIKKKIIIIDNKIIWNKIFSELIIKDFFCTKKIIHLLFLNKNIFFQCQKNIIFLLKNIDKNNILILEIHDYINFNIEKLIKNIINNDNCLFIKNNKLNNYQLDNWINLSFKRLNLIIDKNLIFLLKNSYAKNLTLLNQIINDLYIQKKNNNHILYKNYFNFFSYLKEENFIDYILIGDLKKSFQLITQIKYHKSNIFLILNKLYKNIFLILEIYKKYKKKPTNLIFKKLSIPVSKQKIFIKFLNRINYKQLFLIIKFLLKIEINIKSFIIKNYTEKYFWIDLEKLILLIS